MLKNLIKYIIILVSFCFRKNKKSKVVYYHDVTTKYTVDGTPAELIKKHISILKKCGYSFVPTITEKEMQLMLCFDDGWEGLYEHRQLFLDEGIYPTIFIAVELIGKEGYMTKEQLEELVKLGFRLQAHTYSHQDLGVMKDEELKHELYDAKIALEKMFNQPFDEICFPMGRYSDATLKIALESGYKLMYSSLEGGFFDSIDKHFTYRYFLQSIPAWLVKYYVMGFSKVLYNRAYSQHYVKSN
jgi:peptidoglycan/xylan/chitin deacetylase (PgdA/CDA1 family)